jgi:hypothetical protein
MKNAITTENFDIVFRFCRRLSRSSSPPWLPDDSRLQRRQPARLWPVPHDYRAGEEVVDSKVLSQAGKETTKPHHYAQYQGRQFTKMWPIVWCIWTKGLIRFAFWICSLDERFTVECVFNGIFIIDNSEMTWKTHLTVKRTSKLHIQKPPAIDPYLTRDQSSHKSCWRYLGSFVPTLNYIFIRLCVQFAIYLQTILVNSASTCRVEKVLVKNERVEGVRIKMSGTTRHIREEIHQYVLDTLRRPWAPLAP